MSKLSELSSLLVSIYGITCISYCNSLLEAKQTFHSFHAHNNLTFGSLVHAYLQQFEAIHIL